MCFSDSAEAAIHQYGHDLQHGLGCQKDYKTAFEYYSRAEKHGNIQSINQLGAFFSDEKFGIGLDYNRAYQHLLRGANLGNRDCTDNLGWCYHYGKGVAKDIQKAIEYYNKAIEIDPSDGYSYKILGFVYLYGGDGVSVDKAMAKEYFKKAAELGNEEAKQKLEEVGL